MQAQNGAYLMKWHLILSIYCVNKLTIWTHNVFTFLLWSVKHKLVYMRTTRIAFNYTIPGFMQSVHVFGLEILASDILITKLI